MKDAPGEQHPLLSPKFGQTIHEPVWYLAHPLAPDSQFTFQQNMDHVLRMMRLCFDAGYKVVAPYHTVCLVLDDDNMEHRIKGLELDCVVAAKLGRIILCGHRLSSGMTKEFQHVISQPGAQWIDLIGLTAAQASAVLHHKKARPNFGSEDTERLRRELFL